MGSSGHNYVVTWQWIISERGGISAALLGKPTCRFLGPWLYQCQENYSGVLVSDERGGIGVPTFQHRKERIHFIHRDLQHYAD